MSDWLDELHDARADLDDVADALYHKSNALYESGNERLAKALSDCARAVEQTARRVHRAAGEAVAEAVRSSDRATANMMCGMVAALSSVHGEAEAGKDETDG